MEIYKIAWLESEATDLEKYYHQFIKENPTACAAWGFILQQEDWNGAAEFYRVYGNGTETGKPYYLLNYYCTSTKQGSVDELYSRNVEEKVGVLCPH